MEERMSQRSRRTSERNFPRSARGADGMGVRGDLQLRREMLEGGGNRFSDIQGLPPPRVTDWSKIDANEAAIDEQLFADFLSSLDPRRGHYALEQQREYRRAAREAERERLAARRCPICDEPITGRRQMTTCGTSRCRKAL